MSVLVKRTKYLSRYKPLCGKLPTQSVRIVVFLFYIMFTVYMHIFPNNKVYIGIKSMGVKYRWHRGYGYSNQPHVYKAIQKYGWDNIKHEIIAENLTAEQAYETEKYLIKKYESTNPEKGYNHSYGGDKVNLGLKCSDETKRKIGNANRGRKKSKETIELQRKASLGRKASLETRKKLSELRKGEKCYWYGKNHTDETKEKISIQKSGVHHQIKEETKIKISKALKGKHNYSNSTKPVPVLCLENRKIYNSISSAAKELNIDISSICAVCRGRKRRVNGLRFRYLTEQEKCQFLQSKTN